jgi:hypothetical protein
MKRNRYILCLLLGSLLLYLAVPEFSIFATGVEGVFTISWLVLALLVFAGNLTALLYEPRLRKSRFSGRRSNRKVRSIGD